ncbi:hypothetical protein JCM5353_006291 [Sporobolomyces roseus]
MSNSQSVTILASLGDTLNLIDAVKDKWTTHTLPASERWALNNWETEQAHAAQLDSGNGTDTFDSVGEININQSRCLPRRPYGRITSCLQGILNDCETGQYDNPSALPMLMDDNGKVKEMFERHGVHRSPSLAFLAVEFYLDWIGFELFKWHSSAYHITYDHYVLATLPLSLYLAQNDWETLRDEIVKALYRWWSSHDTEFTEKHRIVMDLQRLYAKTRHSHPGGQTSAGTSQSLGRSSNRFFPGARSLASRRF